MLSLLESLNHYSFFKSNHPKISQLDSRNIYNINVIRHIFLFYYNILQSIAIFKRIKKSAIEDK